MLFHGRAGQARRSGTHISDYQWNAVAWNAVAYAMEAIALTPQQKTEKIFNALVRQLEALARRHPIMTVFEDVHWTDPNSRELLVPHRYGIFYSARETYLSVDHSRRNGDSNAC
jgi:hypothetical protein